MTVLRSLGVSAGRLLGPLVVTLALTGMAWSADSLPGDGVGVTPLKSSIAEETFQTLLS